MHKCHQILWQPICGLYLQRLTWRIVFFRYLRKTSMFLAYIWVEEDVNQSSSLCFSWFLYPHFTHITTLQGRDSYRTGGTASSNRKARLPRLIGKDNPGNLLSDNIPKIKKPNPPWWASQHLLTMFEGWACDWMNDPWTNKWTQSGCILAWEWGTLQNAASPQQLDIREVTFHHMWFHQILL